MRAAEFTACLNPYLRLDAALTTRWRVPAFRPQLIDRVVVSSGSHYAVETVGLKVRPVI